MPCAGHARMLVGSELQLGRRDLDGGPFQVLGEYVPNAPLLLAAAIQKLARPYIKIGGDYRAKGPDAGLRGLGALSVGLLFRGRVPAVPNLPTQLLSPIAGCG